MRIHLREFEMHLGQLSFDTFHSIIHSFRSDQHTEIGIVHCYCFYIFDDLILNNLNFLGKYPFLVMYTRSTALI